MYRCIWLLMLLACAVVASLADGFATRVAWPGGYITTDEDAPTTQYPLTHMLDGNPATAWVLNKQLAGSRDANHGKGRCFDIMLPHGVKADGIGIINGYAKSRAIYRRNNRIRQIQVASGWEQTIRLKETISLQQFTLKEPVTDVEITIEDVAVGKDDDTCISELVLYYKGKPIPWSLTPTVVTNPSSHGDCGCGGGPDYTLQRLDGSLVKSPNDNPITFIAYAFQPGSERILLSAKHHAYLYDLRKGEYRFQTEFANHLEMLGWQDAHVAWLTFTQQINDEGDSRWFRLTDGETISFQEVRVKKAQEPKLCVVGEGPNYGR